MMAARRVTDRRKGNPQPWTLPKAERHYYVHGLHNAKTPTLAGAYNTKPQAMKAARRLANEEGEPVSISPPKGSMIVVSPNPATRQNIFGFGRKPAPAPVARRGRTGGLSLTEASSSALKAGRTSGDLSDFDSWLERKRLDTRSDAVISRIRDAYKRGVDKADADEQNKQFLKDKREQARETARDRAEQARDERASAGRGGKSKAAAASSGYSSAPDEETIQRGFKRGLTLNEILRGNPAMRKRAAGNPALRKHWQRAIDGYMKGRSNPAKARWDVFYDGEPILLLAAKTGAEARRIAIRKWFSTGIDTAADKRKITVRKHPELGWWEGIGRRDRPTDNPAAASAEVFEDFHGFPSSEVVTVSKKVHHHAHLAALGTLTQLDVWGVDGIGHKITGFKGALLACNETRDQLFVEGGDQRINLEDFGIRKPHETETLGRVTNIGYQTNKTHLGDEGGQAVYVHRFRAINKAGKHVVVKMTREPDLMYDVRNEQLLFSGGSYEILREGINK